MIVNIIAMRPQCVLNSQSLDNNYSTTSQEDKMREYHLVRKKKKKTIIKF